MRLTNPPAQAEVSALFSYDRRDPFAVSIRFSGAGCSTEDQITWLVGRDLLRAGLDWPTGDGDVRVGPTATSDVLFLHLRTPEAETLMEFSRPALATFVAASERLVPFGSEETLIDFDVELSVLLSDGDEDPTPR